MWQRGQDKGADIDEGKLTCSSLPTARPPRTQEEMGETAAKLPFHSIHTPSSEVLLDISGLNTTYETNWGS